MPAMKYIRKPEAGFSTTLIQNLIKKIIYVFKNYKKKNLKVH